MKIQVIYSSQTGCTERLANAIFDGIPSAHKTLHDLADGAPALDGDIILLGFWGISGRPNPEMEAFLPTVQGKAVGLFCTLGYYADSAHAQDTLRAGLDLVKYSNEILGTYVCNGAISPALIEEQGLAGPHTPTQQKEIRWEVTASHPTPAECALGAERFRERIYLYQRCRDLKISFSSIL